MLADPAAQCGQFGAEGVAIGVAHALRDAQPVFGLCRQGLRLLVVQVLQAVFQAAQKLVILH